jgi:enoyl-CoA hydratase
MQALVKYELVGSVATVTMDDGKVNVISNAMQSALHHALDQAESDKAPVVLAGRPGVFSAGFDLSTLRGGGVDAQTMVIGGFALSERVLSFPAPVIVACTGHAIAMGMFLLLSGDYLVGAQGSFKFQANEVAMKLTMPRAAVEILCQRLSPACLPRAVTLSETFDPANAVSAGILDEVVAEDELIARALQIAEITTALDPRAHRKSKMRVRERSLRALRAAIEADSEEFIDRL